MFFSKKKFWFPMLLKKIFWFWWRKKKKSDSEFLSYNLMLNSGKKNNILTLVLSEKFFLNETKNHNPPFQVKWSVPKATEVDDFQNFLNFFTRYSRVLTLRPLRFGKWPNYSECKWTYLGILSTRTCAFQVSTYISSIHSGIQRQVQLYAYI